MISICMAVKNGESFIEAQIQSILTQLGVNDELIISDDHSDDATITIIEAFNDKRIIIVKNGGSGIQDNFENALNYCSGEKVFLADQDDVWADNKITKMSQLLDEFDVVVCDCTIVDSNLKTEFNSFFAINRSGKGLLKNIMRNSYMGCCMAFKRIVLTKILPFPSNIPMHDLWIGLVSELHFSVFFLPEKLVLYRRHYNNASSIASSRSLRTKITSRLYLIKNLLRTTYA